MSPRRRLLATLVTLLALAAMAAAPARAQSSAPAKPYAVSAEPGHGPSPARCSSGTASSWCGWCAPRTRR